MGQRSGGDCASLGNLCEVHHHDGDGVEGDNDVTLLGRIQGRRHKKRAIGIKIGRQTYSSFWAIWLLKLRQCPRGR